MFIEFKVMVRLDDIRFVKDEDYIEEDEDYDEMRSEEEDLRDGIPWTLDIKIEKELWDDMCEEERIEVYREHLRDTLEEDYPSHWIVDDIEISVLCVAK